MQVKEDCVHYCLPGAVDAWSMLIYNWMRVNAQSAVGQQLVSVTGMHYDQGTIATSRAAHRTIAGQLGQQRRRLSRFSQGNRSNSRFFASSLKHWLSERGASTYLEKCVSGRGCSPPPKLYKHLWFAFNCSRK